MRARRFIVATAVLAALAGGCGAPAPVALALPPAPSFCGDGVVAPPEECDDGDADDRDSCLSDCTVSTCADGVRGGAETGVDCGGPDCPGCPAGETCARAIDCAGGVCARGVCVQTLCAAAAYQGRAYLFCNQPATWADARAACLAWGYDLFAPDDSCENAFAVETFTTELAPHRWWIGMTDVAEEGVWLLPDGTPATYFDWWFGEPNDYSDEDCVEYRRDGFWNDNDCEQTIRYICEEP
jgi:cysteine-rich repeat protein